MEQSKRNTHSSGTRIFRKVRLRHLAMRVCLNMYRQAAKEVSVPLSGFLQSSRLWVDEWKVTLTSFCDISKRAFGELKEYTWLVCKTKQTRSSLKYFGLASNGTVNSPNIMDNFSQFLATLYGRRCALQAQHNWCILFSVKEWRRTEARWRTRRRDCCELLPGKLGRKFSMFTTEECSIVKLFETFCLCLFSSRALSSLVSPLFLHCSISPSPSSDRCGLASDMCCCFQQNQASFLRLTFPR